MNKAVYDAPCIEVIIISGDAENVVTASKPEEWTGWWDLDNPDQPVV